MNALTEDPFFVRADRGVLRLRDSSPAIGAGDPGTDLSLFSVNDEGDPIDLDGNSRVIGEVVDVGAYEHQGVSDP